jgi:hypothetical protein
MRDGVELSADLYLPGSPRPVPVLVARTPYNKNTQLARDKAAWYAARGFGFAWMDVRGRGDSDGVFTPYRYEGPDGHDAVEWLAAQPWCTGQVATWGASYLGCIQLLTALTRPPHLAAMVVYVTPSDPWIEWPTGLHVPQEICWHRMVSGRLLQYVDGTDWMEVYRHLPLLTMDEKAGFYAPHWREDLSHPPADRAYWQPVTYQDQLAGLDLPALHITGWYDDVQPGTLINFAALADGAATERARRAQRLVVGPWGHECSRNRPRQLGDIDFGPGADFDLDRYELRWLQHYLAGQDNGADAEPRAQIFVMGRNQWRAEDAWPLARTEWARYHLTSAGQANSRHGDGGLRREQPPGDEPPDVFKHDPADPVPFLTEPSSAQIGGPDDYAQVQERADVLVYSTPPLAAEVEVTGPVRVELFASSSAPDTDFMAKLVDVHPDGYCQRLCDGMVRARFREGMDREVLMEPGTVYRFEIDLWSTSQVFLAGHRIRLEIASSAFPKYDRNLGTGGPLGTGTSHQPAQNTVWHTSAYPSALILPQIPA